MIEFHLGTYIEKTRKRDEEKITRGGLRLTISSFRNRDLMAILIHLSLHFGSGRVGSAGVISEPGYKSGLVQDPDPKHCSPFSQS